jgi:hypothetical protein
MRLNGMIPAESAPSGRAREPAPPTSRIAAAPNLSTAACEQFVTNSRLLSPDILGLLFALQNDVQPTLKCA